MSEFEMSPFKFKEAMNKQSAYQLLFNQHVALNYSNRQAILNCHRIISEESPEGIQSIIDGKKVIDIPPKPNAGASPLIPCRREIVAEWNKEISKKRASRIIEAECHLEADGVLNPDG